MLWLGVAALLGAGSFAGGDTSIVCGWGFLAWTVPFGVIWQFAVSDLLPTSVAHSPVVEVAATIVVVALGYVFWFIAVPKIVSKAHTSSPMTRNAL